MRKTRGGWGDRRSFFPAHPLFPRSRASHFPLTSFPRRLHYLKNSVAQVAYGSCASCVSFLLLPTVGVAYDTYQKKLSSDTKKAGLHNGAPGFKFIKFPSVFKTLEFDKEECLNREGVDIELQIEFQYRARPQKLRDIIMEFKDHDNYVKMIK